MVSGEEQRLGTVEDAPRRGPGRGARSAGQIDQRAFAERDHAERELSEDRELNELDRLELFRESLIQSVLPDLPTIPGYHVCWLTTTNPRDSIQWRRRIGYELIRVEEVDGWDGVHINAGDYAGTIGVLEMVAAKIPLRLYNAYMREVHHVLPLQQEEKLRAQTDAMRAQAEAHGSRIIEGGGTERIVQRATPMPEFNA